MNKKDRTFILNKIKKIRAVNLLGGKCIKCGNGNIFQLVFHHENENEKDHNPADMIREARWSLIEPEIKKCILLCENCHRELHASNDITTGQLNKNTLLKAIQRFKCEKCGYDKCYNALEFHHIDKNNKSFGIVEETNNMYSSKISDITNYLLNETNKCMLVCRNCHDDLHFDQNRYNKYYPEILNKLKSYKETPRLTEKTKKLIRQLRIEGKGYNEIKKITGASYASICHYIYKEPQNNKL